MKNIKAVVATILMGIFAIFLLAFQKQKKTPLKARAKRVIPTVPTTSTVRFGSKPDCMGRGICSSAFMVQVDSPFVTVHGELDTVNKMLTIWFDTSYHPFPGLKNFRYDLNNPYFFSGNGSALDTIVDSLGYKYTMLNSAAAIYIPPQSPATKCTLRIPNVMLIKAGQ